MKPKNVLDELGQADEDADFVKDSSELLAEFLATKRLEGKTSGRAGQGECSNCEMGGRKR